MCFENLPIEFDESGRAQLKGGISDPYSVSVSRPEVAMTEEERVDQIRRLMARNGHIKDLSMDPMTRVAGALALQMTADLDERRYLNAYAQAPLFRGYEVILMGRDPRDAAYIASRVCGVCGGVHIHASAYAVEMAMGLAPPPMGTVIRNMGETAEMGYDNPLHLYLLAGPDYSEAVVRQTNPEVWSKAENWRCPGERWHQFKTMDQLMTALNPLTGELYLEGLEFTRTAREMFVLLQGKYPHPEAVVPGGVTTTVTMQTLNEYHSKLGRLFDYAQRMMAVWDDIAEFFYDCDERQKQVGATEMNLVDTGYWDDPFAYDATYANCDEWGQKRYSTPGAVINGELVTTRLTDLNIGLEEFVEHSYYDDWSASEPRFTTDPSGNPISPYHPWNKRTLPKPTGKNFRERYTWDCAPRWDRKVVEAGCYNRLWITAMAQMHPQNDFYEATGNSIRMHVPKGRTPQSDVEWRIPEVWNAFERNRGRAYHYLFSQLVALNSVLAAYDLMKQGETRVAAANPDELERAIPKDEQLGVGFWGAGRGWLTHHVVLDNGKIANYQVVTPSSFNASPRDPFDQPGPYEQAIMNTPILENFSDSSEFTSVDMLRAIRSFDPCMPCTTHVHTAAGTVVREVNTCACGAD